MTSGGAVGKASTPSRVTGSRAARRILVACRDGALRGSLRDGLEREGGFEVQESSDPVTTAALAAGSRPDAIVLEATSGSDMAETVALLRKDFRTAFVPIVYLSDAAPGAELVGGADDYVLKPFDPAELVARVRVTLQRSAALRGLNPLTGLPGNTVIEEEIRRRLSEAQSFACLYMDLDHFKSYNDRYGFTRGDEVISALAEAIVTALEHCNEADCFAGHVGGDDFVVLTPVERGESVAEAIAELFGHAVRKLYEPTVRRRGWIEVTDRQGRASRVPLCSVSIGIVYSHRDFSTPAQMAEAAAEVKAVAKRQAGSSWATDRRRA